ncbi:TAP-like protein-domain-containing protein [Xylaria bambusicola]|uniref:TAP-like protein-domain-containing protein n=1 Tax=Xylaria bambusicola TaxID=326684 RepID=UPI00200866BF|nr:TAP-like protein-domain-containing protein [Xylaria bambusicola]KAI0508335.1 TAP-like protein-domain-containing protein [Xylaria bambusicola]
MARLSRFIAAGIATASLGQAAPLAIYQTSNSGVVPQWTKPPVHPSNSSAVQQWVKQSGQSIKWGACSDQFPDPLTCATFRVPLDWNNIHSHSNETVELGMVRLEAEDKENRIGYLFVNPGGPGGQATSTVSGLSDRVDPEIRARFDIIGLDPRGVGISTPVQCDPAAFNKRVKFMPTTEKEYDALVQYNKDLGANCLKKTGPLVNFVDTISAVKDHEAVRLALGEKATYLGLSYGTQLFSQFAALFPDSFRAIVLDGNLQRSQSESSNLLIESTAYQATLGKFFEWCTATDECALQGADVEAVFKSVRDKASAEPIPAPGCDDKSCRSDVTEEDFLFTAQGFMISERNWPRFSQALVEADKGNATLVSQFNQIAIGDAYEDSYLYAGTAIGCQDWAHASTGLADVVEKQNLGAVFSPLTLGACQSYKLQTSCIGWPAPLSNLPAPIVYDGDVKLLMVNSLYDPSTSYTWALGLQKEIENAVLLTRNGSGHTSYLLGGETTNITNQYLLHLELPKPGTVTSS